MQRQDLGQFLYDDAWARLTPELRHVLLLMSRLGDTHDQYLMQLCCQRAKVTVAAASEAIEESKGIGTISRFQGAVHTTFSPEFHNYCIERVEVIDGVRYPTNEEVDWVSRRYSEFLTSASALVRDRNPAAFLVPEARAAWKAFDENRLDDALGYYEAAVLIDSENGLLFDRYARTLMKKKDLPLALRQSEKAAHLLPDSAEVYFTKGMIEARLGESKQALIDLDKAVSLGKEQYLCELQKAYAHVYSLPQDLKEARSCLHAAYKAAPKVQLGRFTEEATRFERRWLS
jgi:tetratricopeptide (TPR) repeat protein